MQVEEVEKWKNLPTSLFHFSTLPRFHFFHRLTDTARADSRIEARSCPPPVCSARCSTSRTAPWARPCSCTRGVRISLFPPYRPPYRRTLRPLKGEDKLSPG